MRPRVSSTRLLGCLLVLLAVPVVCANPPTRDEAEARWRVAMQLARERNDRDLVAALESVVPSLKAGPTGADAAALADLERRAGIDPGGWSMAGQPIFRPSRELKAQTSQISSELSEAMVSGDAARVRAVTERLQAILGSQAGLPDARRPGVRVDVKPLGVEAATRLFAAAMRTEERRLQPVLEGRPLPGQMARVHGVLLEACTLIRPLSAQHAAAEQAWLDRLSEGAAGALLALQQPDGYFPFPDLRGKNIRFGDLVSKAVASGHAEVRDGWVVSVDPEGGSQFDTGVCGVALLRAARERGVAAWRQAGLRAAAWALAQPCVPNFNYNAFSISLLAEAYAETREARYLDGAWAKFRVGLAPGQASNGRWMDAHNARTVYHVIILRALADLGAVLPADWREQREELAAVTRRAVAALLDEFDAMGVTVEALPELQKLSRLDPDDPRLRGAVAAMASAIVAKCTDGRRVKLGAQPEQLAAVARVSW